MRYILSIVFIFGLFSAQAQSPTRIKLTQLEQSKVVEGSKAGQIPLSNSAGDLRYAQYVEIDLVPIGFVPTATGNSSNFSEFVTASDGTKWYIDWQGRGYQFSGSGTDKNGYYGGNGGNGGDAIIPSVTKSTLTNQLTWYKALDDTGGFVPLRVQVDAGNESDFMSFRQGPDSLLISRSDQEFVETSTKGFILIAADIMGIFADSIQISTVPTAFPQERTFLTYSPNNTITKKEGIDSSDLNFNPIQQLTATGAGPTSYNIALSNGGFVTLQEGPNIDLTRSGNTITITASGSGGGSQTFDNTSTATTHTLTLSNSGGSLEYNEGAGIGFTTGGTGLNGTLTIVNTSPDQTVTITNGGGITVTGTYPNFTLTAADQSPTNEIQTISASGAGPTAYNIDLSLSGGSVTLTEGANVDLTRVGNNITIAATSGLQTLNNTSTATTHTTTLSNSGGSVQFAEGTGIGLATTGTALDGIVTITNSAPDQTVTITNGGGITVTGTYPNFTLTAADQSPTNEIQTISASGAGPTAYNIDLSLSGGSVTLTEGANVDLTRVGNNITIAATSGLQTLNNTSTATTHTTTLSNSGGSVQFAEGTGIGLATTGTALDGIVTITNSAPDQTVTITNGGGITVTGTYPNFTLTAADQSPTNEIQTISASGAGPTSYNIDLSLSGGSVTLAEGANVDLTRSGNTITIASALNQSIYTADGTVFADCDATLQSGKYFQFDWFGGNNAFEINDLSNYSILKSKDTQGSIRLDNSSINATRWNAGFTEYSQWYLVNSAAELDYNNEVVFQCNTNGFQCISTTNTFQPPPMTTAQKNAIFPIFDGGIVYDTDLLKFQFRQGGAWLDLFTPSGLFYQTIKVNGGAQPQENFVNYVNTATVEFTGTDVPGSAWTKIEANVPTNGITATQLATGSVTSTKILDGTIAAADFSQMGATSGQAMVWNGSAWVATSVPGTTVVTQYTTPGSTTVSVPAGAIKLEVICMGGGGGGGSGRIGAVGTSRGGGGGGGGAAVSFGSFSIAELGSPANITVNVGAGGGGGASRTTNDTNGQLGTSGGDSYVSITTVRFVFASGGFGGDGGTTTAGGGGSGGQRGDFNGLNNGGGAGGSSSSVSTKQPSGGGAGASITAGNATASGGTSGSCFYVQVSGVVGDGDGGAAGNAPGAGQLSGSGGAGGGTTAGVQANGGAGGRGAGGGGGAGGTNATINSGAGGAGGGGYVLLTWYF